MFAIIETGGKQFRVEEGRYLSVEKLDVEEGKDIVLDKVLMVNNGEVKIGQPYVENAKVTCEVLEHGRGKKVIVFKKRRRKDSAVKRGHRQEYTKLMVKAINA